MAERKRGGLQTSSGEIEGISGAEAVIQRYKIV